MNISTWNVQGFRGKIEELIFEINKLKMDIVILTETKKERSFN